MDRTIQGILHRLTATAAIAETGSRQLAILPPEHHVVDVTIPEVPGRVIARPIFHDGNSLAAYVQRFKLGSSIMVADIDASDVVVALDYHTGDADNVEAVDHVARWPLAHSEEYRAWARIEGKLIEQGEFMRFLEENAMDVVSPDPAQIMDLVRDFDAVKTVKFRSSRRLDNGDRRLEYVEDTGTKSGVAIPQKLTLSIPIYRGEAGVTFDVLFRYRIKDGQLLLGFEWHRLEPVKQAAFVAAVTRVGEAAGMAPMYGMTASIGVPRS